MANPAIVASRGGKYYDASGNEVASPSQSELDAQEVKVKDDWQKAYENRRKEEYPSIGDQLDSLYHAGAFDSTMTAKLKAVKDKWPKS